MTGIPFNIKSFADREECHFPALLDGAMAGLDG